MVKTYNLKVDPAKKTINIVFNDSNVTLPMSSEAIAKPRRHVKPIGSEFKPLRRVR